MLSFTLLLLAALTPGDEVRAAVVCAETAFSRSAEARDDEAFLAFVDDEARFISGEVLRGPDEVGEAWAPFFEADGPAIRWRPMVVEVVADATLAISRGPYRVAFVDKEGAAQERWGTFTSVWRRHDDGEWRVLFDAGGDAGKEPSDEERELLGSEPDCD